MFLDMLTLTNRPPPPHGYTFAIKYKLPTRKKVKIVVWSWRNERKQWGKRTTSDVKPLFVYHSTPSHLNNKNNSFTRENNQVANKKTPQYQDFWHKIWRDENTPHNENW